MKLLVIDASEAETALLVQKLRVDGGEHDTTRVETLDATREALATRDWDVILADARAPDADIYEVLDLRRRIRPEIPLLVVSGPADEIAVAGALRAGAFDWIPKARLDLLASAVGRALRETELERREWVDSDAAPVDQLHLIQTLVEQTTEAIASTDTDEIIQYVNPAFERTTGYPREDAVGRHISMLASGEHDDAFFEDMRRKVDRGEVWSGRVINRRRDGSHFEADVVVSMIRNGQGRTVGHVHTLRDVSLEVLLREQLRQAQKTEAIGRLAGGIAHDFNNLLTAIGGYSELLLPEIPSDDPRHRQVAEIRRAAARAAELTHSLLAFSRHEDIQPILMELNTLVDGVAKMLRRLIGEDIILETSMSPGLGLVKADPTQIEQILVNLAINARDAMPTGGTLTIALENVDVRAEDLAEHPVGQPGRYVLLSVADTGVGMSTDTLAQVFEPFFTTKGLRENGDPEASNRGTSLGLATVHGIVQRSGGHIWACSEPDRGSTFKILLPRVDAAARIDEIRPPEVGIESGSQSILVVEDEAAVRRIAVEILGRAGYVIVSARSAQEALEISDQFSGPIHVLLTDIVMPDMNGIELAREWRSRRPESRVIYMTGYSKEMLSRFGKLDPDCLFLEKPFTPTALSRTLRRALDSCEARI